MYRYTTVTFPSVFLRVPRRGGEKQKPQLYKLGLVVDRVLCNHFLKVICEFLICNRETFHGAKSLTVNVGKLTDNFAGETRQTKMTKHYDFSWLVIGR